MDLTVTVLLPCRRCKVLKPTVEFWPSSVKRLESGRNKTIVCATCESKTQADRRVALGLKTRRPRLPGETREEYRQRWHSENPDKRRAWELKRYGMTLDDYEALLESQGGVCACCGQPETRTNKAGKLAPLHVDHDHDTGKVRGLLCCRCNFALGYLREDATIARLMVDYITERCS